MVRWNDKPNFEERGPSTLTLDLIGTRHIRLSHDACAPRESKSLEKDLGGKVTSSLFHCSQVRLAHRNDSRRPPPEEMMALLPQDQRDRVEHVACDFLSKPEEIAKQLTDKNVTGDYIFFYSYAQPKPDPGNPVCHHG